MNVFLVGLIFVFGQSAWAGSLDCSVSSKSPGVESVSFTLMENGDEWQTGIAINWKDGGEANFHAQLSQDISKFPLNYSETTLVTETQSVKSDAKGIIGGLMRLTVRENQDERSALGELAVMGRVIEFICQ